MFLCMMKTVQDALKLFTNLLSTLYPKTETETLYKLAVSDVTGLSYAQLRAFPETGLSTSQATRLTYIAEELQTGKPIQYILGHTEFYGLPFKVNPSVLIPRPETEELVEWVIASVKARNLTEHILDIGTGSGCIPITLKKNLPNARVAGMDISAEALATAKLNAELNNVDVAFGEADILLDDSLWSIDHSNEQNTTAKPWTMDYGLWTIIISNPPYVTQQEKGAMHPNVLDFEPHTALFVPDNDPLLFYRAIADFALQNLTNNGLLFFEINENLGRQTVDLLAQKGFSNIELRQDMPGKDRMIRSTLIN
jgi:release factor glutamine methyltransferase